MSLKFVLLTLINRNPQTGYEIVKTFDSAVGYFWHASHQQVYRELGTLAESGLVKFKLKQQPDKPDKKIYRISVDGKKALVQWLEEPLKQAGSKDALLVKLLNAGTVESTVLLEELELEKIRTTQRLKAYREIDRNYREGKAIELLPITDQILYLALRKGIRYSEASLSWIEEAIQTMGKF